MGKAGATDLPRGVTIREYPSGLRVLQIQFSYRGQSCKEILHGLEPTKTNQIYAANKKNQIEYEKTMGTFRYGDHFPNSPKAAQFGEIKSNTTVGEKLLTLLGDYEKSKEHSTARKYRASIETILMPILGKFLLTDLADNPEPIRQMIRSRNVTLKTIRNDLTPLRAVFDQAVIDNLCDRNPLDKIKVKNLADKRKHTDAGPDPLSLDEIMHFLKTADQVKPKWKNYFQFAFFSGLRVSELYGLEKQDIDFDEHSVSICRAVVEREEKGTKTEAGKRTIDLLPMAESALRAELEQHIAPSDRVWINPNTRKPIRDYEHTGRAWKYIMDKAGLRHRGQKQTRHSFCSNQLSGGENIYYIAQQMGHVNIEMVIKHYGKWVEEGRKKRRREWVSEFANTKP